MAKTNNLAIIDLGSNSVRLKISEIKENGETETKQYVKNFVRLSSEMGPEKVLKEEPMQRTIDALHEFREIVDGYDKIKEIAVATAAVRQAQNQREFLDRVKNEAGFDIKVISGAQEAYLDYVGVSHTLDMEHGLIIDTGGASMEIIGVDNGAAEETISIPMGSVILSQRHKLGDKIDPADLFDAMVEVDEALSHQRWLARFRRSNIVALGGCNRALAKIFRWRNAVDGKPAPIHGLTLTADEAFEIMHELLETDKEGRAAIRGINKERADVIVGGLLPLLALMRQLAIDEVQFSNSGLREGLLYKFREHSLDFD
ncbi:MAG: Ppx/GppA family phosphatase [Limosilactobacillus sp.]|uniref:Ppx/GppA family phosphatase n=1 Tax=Limosilactobacillus sp. TaxID=2773925 RepID=UPI002710D009|nr:Ppx/GppA family phosphatase [Limosilactobacillus sp.]